MSTWYVHRRANNTVQSIHGDLQLGYAEELLDDSHPDIIAFRAALPPLPDLSDSNNLPKALKAVVLAAALMSGKTVAQAKAAFKTAWDSLP